MLQEPAARLSIGTGRGGHATRAFSFVAVLIPTACAATAAGTGRDRAAVSRLVEVSVGKGCKGPHNLGKDQRRERIADRQALQSEDHSGHPVPLG